MAKQSHQMSRTTNKDWSSVEVFSGENTLTAQVFPGEDATYARIFSSGTSTEAVSLQVSTVSSIWN